MEQFQEPDPQVVSDEILARLQSGDDSEWDNIRIDIAGILRMNQDYKKTKQTVQNLLESSQLKQKLRAASTSEYDIADLVELGGGTLPYKKALSNLLTRDTEFGKELYSRISEMVDSMIGEKGQVFTKYTHQTTTDDQNE